MPLIPNLSNLNFVRRWKNAQMVKLFLRDKEAQGVRLRDESLPFSLAEIHTVVIDASLIMEGWNAVRMVAAPLEACDISQFRRQSSWMMLTAGVALGCDGYAPLVEFAREMSFEVERMQKQFPKIDFIPYDDSRGIETTVHRDAGGLRAYSKGDPEAVLSRCTEVLDGSVRAMTDEDRQMALESAMDMESLGLHTLAFSSKWLESSGEFEQEMVFLGIVGTGDLPRPEARDWMDRLRGAALRPMLLSVEPLDEAAVRDAGILREEGSSMNAQALSSLEGTSLREAVLSADAFFGIDPTLRGRLLRVLRSEGPVALVAPGANGGVTVTLGRGDLYDAALKSEDLSAVANLISECRSLAQAQRAPVKGQKIK